MDDDQSCLMWSDCNYDPDSVAANVGTFGMLQAEPQSRSRTCGQACEHSHLYLTMADMAEQQPSYPCLISNEVSCYLISVMS